MQRFSFKILFLFPAGFTSAMCFAQAKNTYILTGEALDPSTKALIYKERHTVEQSDNNLDRLVTTEFSNPNGKVFARMTNDFSKNPYIPDLSFEDDRFALKQSQTYDKATNKITLTQKMSEKELETKSFTAPENLVSGHGFDNFIKTNFDKPAYIKMPLAFVILEKLDFYLFDLIPRTTMKNQKEFSLQASSFFIKLFSKEVKLTYDPSSKRLLRFEGLSNLANNKYENQDVIINYTSSSFSSKKE